MKVINLKRLRFLITIFSLLIGFTGVLMTKSMTPIQADSTYPTNGTPSGPPFQFLGGYLVGGFSQQPADLNTISDQSYSLTVNGARGFFDPLFFSNLTWYEYGDNHKWTQVNQGSSLPDTFTTSAHVTQVTTRYYQASVTYTGIFSSKTFWSQTAKVTISPQAVSATNISVDAASDTLPNGNSINMQAILTPSNATDKVTWSIDNSSIASIDANMGTLTANSDTKKYGPVKVTATTANGLSASKQMYVGALQDTVVPEGQTATFSVKGFPTGSSIIDWHQVTPDGKDTIATSQPNISAGTGTNQLKNGLLTIKNTTYAQNNYRYYADIQLPDGSQKATTNSATLEIIKGQDLSLDAVPNFVFRKSDQTPLSISDIAKGTTLTASKTVDVKNQSGNYDGNDRNALFVYDPRPASSGWRLSASMSPFTNTQTGQIFGGHGGLATLTMIDTTGQTVGQLVDNQTTTLIKSNTKPNLTADADLSPSKLTLQPTSLVTPGPYDATIYWTLANVPDP